MARSDDEYIKVNEQFMNGKTDTNAHPIQRPSEGSELLWRVSCLETVQAYKFALTHRNAALGVPFAISQSFSLNFACTNFAFG